MVVAWEGSVAVERVRVMVRENGDQKKILDPTTTLRSQLGSEDSAV